MSWNLPDADRAKIEALKPNPNADCQYDPMRSMLIWKDDCPPDVSADGRYFIQLLSVARKYIHDGDATLEMHEGYRQDWDRAKSIGLRWNGFAHVELTPDERSYYDECRSNPDPFGIDEGY